jgi:hypothetical protein
MVFRLAVKEIATSLLGVEGSARPGLSGVRPPQRRSRSGDSKCRCGDGAHAGSYTRADGPRESPHRYPDGSLCMWYPQDPPEQKWVFDDGLLALLNYIQAHLFREAWWGENGPPARPRGRRSPRRSHRPTLLRRGVQAEACLTAYDADNKRAPAGVSSRGIRSIERISGA